jgi:peroxiredoxin
MSENGAPPESMPSPPPGRGVWSTLLRYVDLRRLILAALLLAALFGVFYLVERRNSGGDGSSAQPALLMDTPKDPDHPELAVGAQLDHLAPDFEASDLDGVRFSLSDFRGRPVVINFWATWCTSCLAELPELKALLAERQEDDLAVVAVNVGESPQRARDFIDFLEASFDVALDPSLTVADAYGVYGLPVSVFLDRDGVVRARYVGQTDREVLDQFVTAAVQAVPAADPPRKLRLVTTVPRDHILYVDEGEAGTVRLASKSLRCDENYCVEGLEAAVAAVEGVSSLVREATDPPALVVDLDASVLSVESLVATVVDHLESNPDPLYDRPLEVLYESP